MPGPWERYSGTAQAESGPWARYGAQQPSQETPQPNAEPRVEQSTLPAPVRAFVGLGAGLTQRGVGAIQAGADLVGAKGISEAAGRATAQIDRDVASLGTSGEVGRVIGDIAPALALPGAAATSVGRVGLSATAGAVEGATRAKTEGDGLDRVFDAGTGAALGLAGGAALEGAGAAFRTGKQVAKGFANNISKVAVPTAEDVAGQARVAYQQAEKSGGVLVPNVTNSFLDEAARTLTPQTEAGRLVAGDSVSAKLAERLSNLRNRPMTLQEAQEVDEALGDVIDGLTELGRPTKEGRKVLQLQTAFRNSIDAAAEADVVGGKAGFDALKQGRQLWSQAARLRDVEKIIARAEMTDNPATAIKTGFRTLASNPARLRGYSPETQKLIKQAAESGIVGDTLRVASSRLIPIIAGSTGNIGGALAAQAATTAARGAASSVQANKALRVAESIARGGQAVPSVAERAGGAIRRAVTGKPGAVAAGLGVGGAAAAASSGNASAPMPKAGPEASVSAPQPFNLDTYLKNAEKAEGKGKNPLSSARGVGQFINSTWLEEYPLVYPEKAAGMTPRQILAEREKPDVARQVFRNFTSRNVAALEKAGRSVTAGTVYASHFLGKGDVSQLLDADPRKLVTAVLSKKVLDANPFLKKGVRVRDLQQATEIAASTGKPLATILKEIRTA